MFGGYLERLDCLGPAFSSINPALMARHLSYSMLSPVLCMLISLSCTDTTPAENAPSGSMPSLGTDASTTMEPGAAMTDAMAPGTAGTTGDAAVSDPTGGNPDVGGCPAPIGDLSGIWIGSDSDSGSLLTVRVEQHSVTHLAGIIRYGVEAGIDTISCTEPVTLDGPATICGDQTVLTISSPYLSGNSIELTFDTESSASAQLGEVHSSGGFACSGGLTTTGDYSIGPWSFELSHFPFANAGLNAGQSCAWNEAPCAEPSPAGTQTWCTEIVDSCGAASEGVACTGAGVGPSPVPGYCSGACLVDEDCSNANSDMRCLSMASCGQTENPTWGFAINRCWEADAIGVVEDRVCE